MLSPGAGWTRTWCATSVEREVTCSEPVRARTRRLVSGRRGIHEQLRGDEEDEEEDESDSQLPSSPIYHVKSTESSSPIKVLDECLVSMEVDTGAALSLMSEATYQRLWPRRELRTSQVRLQSYTKETIPVLGRCNVNVDYQDRQL